MFIIRLFKQSFQFRTIFEVIKPINIQIIIYFIFISLISAFPLNYQIIRENGFRLDFIVEDFNQSKPNLVTFPCSFQASGMTCDDDFSFTHQGIDYVFVVDEVVDVSIYQEALLFDETGITYVKEGLSLNSNGYQGFFETLDMSQIRFLDPLDNALLYDSFAQHIEQSFSPYVIVYTLFTNTMIHIFVQMIFIVFLMAVLRLFKYNLSRFMTVSESFSFVVMMMTLPAALSVMVALVEPVIASVVYQFLVGIVILIVMLKIGRKYYQ